MDTVTYAILNKKIRGLVSGIQSASVSGTTITFTMNDGSKQIMKFPTPKDGASITNVNIKKISNEYHLICTITDADGNETEIDAGIIPNTKVQIASKSTAGIVKVGDNLKITTDGTLSAIGGGKPYEISKAEYDALTDDERKDKVYYVYDDNEGYEGSGNSDKFTRDDLTTVTVGGLNSGSSVKDKTTMEVLESILFPYQKPTVSFTISPGTTIYESGTTVSSITFTINATKKSNDIQSIKVYDGSALLTTITSDVANGGTFTYSYSCSISSNTTLKVEVSDGTSTVSTTKNITFANKSYYGFVADGVTVDETVIKALQNSSLKTSKALTYGGITCVDSRIVYAYPQSQGLLSSILDGIGFDYIDSYDYTNITIDGVNYNVYVMIDPTTLDGFTQKFA